MKTDKQRIEQLLEMQEHPDRFTDQQIRQAFADDPELKVMMEQLAFAKRTLKNEEVQTANLSVDDEWEKFVAAHKKQPRVILLKRLSKIAAVFIGVVFFAGATIAALHHAKGKSEQTAENATQATSPRPQASSPMKSDTASLEPTVFDKATLEKIVQDIAAAHHAGVEIRNAKARELRLHFVWKREDSLLRVVERLNNFEAVNIAVEDNKIIVK